MKIKMHRFLSRYVVFVLFAGFQIYDCKQPNQENPPRSVNLALETVLEFDNYENSADITIIDKVQSFLNKVKHVIKKSGFRRAGDEEDDIPLSFTEFIKSFLVILTSYNDDDLEQIAAVIDEELRKYHYKGCKFYELVENHNVRRLMAFKLQEIKTRSGNQLKSQLKSIIKKLTDENRDFKHRFISRYLDSLYTIEDSKKFNSFLHSIASYRRVTKRSDMDINKIIKKGLRNIIFDHYSQLDIDTRRDLKIKLESFWKDFSTNNVLRDVWTYESKPHTPDDEKKVEISKKDYGSFEKPKPKKHVSKKKKKHGKRERISSKQVVTEDRKVTKSPKFTFITLYPEAITIPKRKHKRSHHKINNLSKKHKRNRHTTDLDARRVTLEDHKSVPVKQVISDFKYVIDVKGVRLRSVDSVETPKTFRFNVVSNSSEQGPPIKSHISKKQEPIMRVDTTMESDEGLSIDSNFQHSEEERRPLSKSKEINERKPIIKNKEIHEIRPKRKIKEIHERMPMSKSKEIHLIRLISKSKKRHERRPMSKSIEIQEIRPMSKSKKIHERKPMSKNKELDEIKPMSRSIEIHEIRPMSKSKEIRKIRPMSKSKKIHERRPIIKSKVIHDIRPMSKSKEIHKLIRPMSKSKKIHERRPKSKSKEMNEIRPMGKSKKMHEIMPMSKGIEIHEIRPMSQSKEIRKIRTISKSKEMHEIIPMGKSKEIHEIRPMSKSIEIHEIKPMSKSKEIRKIRPMSKSKKIHKRRPMIKIKEIHEIRPMSKSKEIHKIRPMSKSKEIHEIKPIRKSNDNDTLTATPKTAVLNEDVIKRIRQLETELKNVKENFAKNQITTPKIVETIETQYDILDFWERSTLAPTEKKTKTPKPRGITTTTTTSKPTTTTTTTTEPRTTESSTKILTTMKKKHFHRFIKKNPTTQTTVETTAASTTKSKGRLKAIPKVIHEAKFRSDDLETENNEVLPITTAADTTQHFDRFDLKSLGSNTFNVTIKSSTDKTSSTAVKEEDKVTITKLVESTTKETTTNDVENTLKSEVETYLEDIKMLGDDDNKSQVVRQKMMEGLKSLTRDRSPSPSETRETLGTPTEALSVGKILSSTDALAFLDDNVDDIMRK